MTWTDVDGGGSVSHGADPAVVETPETFEEFYQSALRG